MYWYLAIYIESCTVGTRSVCMFQEQAIKRMRGSNYSFTGDSSWWFMCLERNKRHTDEQTLETL